MFEKYSFCKFLSVYNYFLFNNFILHKFIILNKNYSITIYYFIIYTIYNKLIRKFVFYNSCCIKTLKFNKINSFIFQLLIKLFDIVLKTNYFENIKQ